jgi:hypothetical protein
MQDDADEIGTRHEPTVAQVDLESCLRYLDPRRGTGRDRLKARSKDSERREHGMSEAYHGRAAASAERQGGPDDELREEDCV